MKLGVRDYIDSAHFLPGHPKCGSLHGHTYKIELVIEGDSKRGMILDFTDLKKTLREVLSPYDHISLNEVLEYPSVENICEMLREKLADRIPFPFTIRVWEGVGKWVEL